VKQGNILAFLVAVLAGALLFTPFTGLLHLFDWDEINFAESAREMIVTGNYLDVQINFESFWEKPPLFIWMQVLSMKLFGINEFAARFPNAICGIFSLIALFRIGSRLKNEKFGWLWMLTFGGSILPFFYFKSGLIDPWFNLFILLSIVHIAYYFIYDYERKTNLILSAIFIGLSILTKGPVGLLILMLTLFVYMLTKRFKIKTTIAHVLLFTLITTLVGGFWFILQIIDGNYTVIQDFITYQIRLFQTKDAGHGGFLLYHFVVVLIGVFPASFFAFRYLFKKANLSTEGDKFATWMKILLWVVLLLFTIVKTKIVHYSSLAYFPLTFIATILIYKIYTRYLKFKAPVKISILIIALAYAVIIVGISQIDYLKANYDLSQYISDTFTLANLEANVIWSGWEGLIGIAYLFSIIFFLFFKRKNRSKIIGIFSSTIVFTYLVILFITPKIEGYSQNAALEFYESLETKDVYVATLGYKSYAHYFYSKIEPHANAKATDPGWLLTGTVDKPAYFVFKIHRKERFLKQYPQLEVLYEKNGFVFTRRIN